VGFTGVRPSRTNQVRHAAAATRCFITIIIPGLDEGSTRCPDEDVPVVGRSRRLGYGLAIAADVDHRSRPESFAVYSAVSA